jgi:hypothetical protein
VSSSGRSVVLAQQAGVIGANVNLAQNTLTTIITTAPLAIGVWDVSVGLLVAIGAAGDSVDVQVVNGTATAALTGQCSTTVGNGAGVGVVGYDEAVLNFIATVTVAGTLVIQGEMAGSVTASTVLASSLTQAFVSASGYVATKIG